MYLVRLVYTSTVNDGFDSSSITDILKVARKKNLSNDVTGALCFSQKYFLQCLEGSRSKVNQTYHRILNDTRHHNIVMLDYKEIQQREFTDWTMGYLPESSLTLPINLKYSGSSKYNPYEISGESAHLMMLELKNSVPVI